MGDGARGARGQRRDRAGRRRRPLHADARGLARDHQGERRPADRDRPGRRHRRHAVAQPAGRRRLQVQPAARRTGRHRRHVGHRRPGQRADPGWAGRRTAHPVRAGTCGRVVVRLPRRVRRRPAVGGRHRRDSPSGRADRRRPAGWRVGRLLGRDRRAARSRADCRQPAGRPDLAVHDAGLGREDPDGLLVAVGDGEPDRPQGRLRHRDRQRRRRRPPRHRHAGRRADEPQPLPGRRDRLPVRRRSAGLAGLRADRQDARVLVDDRPRRRRASGSRWSRCRSASSGSCPG